MTNRRNSPPSLPAADRGDTSSQQPDTDGRSATQPEPDQTKSRAVCLADLQALPPTLAVQAAARIIGCGRSLAYDLIRRGEFPCRVLRVGRRYLIPTADLLQVLGIRPTGSPGADSDVDDRPLHRFSVPAGQAVAGAAKASR